MCKSAPLFFSAVPVGCRCAPAYDVGSLLVWFGAAARVVCASATAAAAAATIVSVIILRPTLFRAVDGCPVSLTGRIANSRFLDSLAHSDGRQRAATGGTVFLSQKRVERDERNGRWGGKNGNKRGHRHTGQAAA